MAFISPIGNRNNLKVLDRSYVTKLMISKRSRNVQGVYFTRDNKTYFARSRKEVILSAGAISSPQILMLSGIGPKDHLESLGVPLVQNLPVGQRLIEHPYIFVVFSTNITSLGQSTEESIEDLMKGRGSLTRASFIDSVVILQTPVEKEKNYPDVECKFTNISDNAITKRSHCWTDETYDALNASVPNPITIKMYALHPKSRGSIILKSADPFDYPLIDPNVLSDEEDKDLETLYQGVKLILKLTKTQAFREMNFKLAFDSFPGCNHTQPLSREYWYCYFRRVTGVGSHQLGTCAAGTSQETSVVNNKLEVFGVGRLRVADASVLSVPISGHTNAACTMIGEKVSDIIKDSYK